MASPVPKFDVIDFDYAPTNELPTASKDRYNRIYDEFQKWNKLKGETPVTETILLKYFSEMAEKNKPSTLWACYSMLKATLKLNDKIDIGSFSRLTNFLKFKNMGYRPLKAKIFTEEQIDKFINEAPDEKWLAVKVICIFGVIGAYSANKLTNVLIGHIKQYDDLFLVTVPEAESSPQRTFTITGPYFKVVQKYLALRPPHMKNDRFFIQYIRGKCTVQSIGKNTLCDMPRRIAAYLNLPELKRYTGHSFRRSSYNLPRTTLVGQSYTMPPMVKQEVQESLDSMVASPNDSNQTHDMAAHICTLSCGQAKCASEENENSVFHSFDMLKPPDYIITDVTPVLSPTEPTCRWIVAYTHMTMPVDTFNTKEKFEDITRSVPNNVRVIENYIRKNSTQLFAAYVVVYGVNCRCRSLEQHAQPSDSLNSLNFSIDTIKCEI